MVRLIGSEGWLYECVTAFQHVKSAVLSVVVLNFESHNFYECLLTAMAKVKSMNRNAYFCLLAT